MCREKIDSDLLLQLLNIIVKHDAQDDIFIPDGIGLNNYLLVV